MLSLNRLNAGKQLLQQVWAQNKTPNTVPNKQGILQPTHLVKNSLPPTDQIKR